MWGQTANSLVLILIAFLYSMVFGDSKHLDMSPNAVDDQYRGCQDQMRNKVLTSLLKDELNNSYEFKTAWVDNLSKCNRPITGGSMHHTAAQLAYKHGTQTFRQNFNKEVESMGTNASVYENNFLFKSLHFLLMDSFKLLSTNTCQSVFRGSSSLYMASKGSEVRFGRFTSVKLDSSQEIEDVVSADGTFFNITSCSVLNVEANTCSKPGKIDLLLSPAEVFHVVAVKDSTNKDGDKYKEIVLEHSRIHSNHNCFLFPESTAPGISVQWLSCSVLVLMALPFSFCLSV